MRGRRCQVVHELPCAPTAHRCCLFLYSSCCSSCHSALRVHSHQQRCCHRQCCHHCCCSLGRSGRRRLHRLLRMPTLPVHSHGAAAAAATVHPVRDPTRPVAPAAALAGPLAQSLLCCHAEGAPTASASTLPPPCCVWSALPGQSSPLPVHQSSPLPGHQSSPLPGHRQSPRPPCLGGRGQQASRPSEAALALPSAQTAQALQLPLLLHLRRCCC